MVAQLQHLWAASHELATAAPGISAHLMSRFMALSSTTTTTHSAPPTMMTETTGQVEACGACGTIPVPGFQGSVQAMPLGEEKKPAARQNKKSTPTTLVLYRCSACRKYTEQVHAPKPSSLPPPPLSKPRQMCAALHAIGKNGDRTKAKTKIKKNKKAASSSLSKMLATAAAQRQLQQQGTSGTSRQLDLFDLMKTA